MGQRNTEPYRRSFSGSVGAGVGALMGGSHRQYYILEYRSSSKYHHTGETQKIIVDQVELGRDPRCQIRFDDSFTSVSRRHAAIVRDGSAWKLVHLSKTNPTLLNGRPVADEWYLQNGDEIQLSSNGPRLGFIIPQEIMPVFIRYVARASMFRDFFVLDRCKYRKRFQEMQDLRANPQRKAPHITVCGAFLHT